MGVSIFISAFFIVYALLNADPSSKTSNLNEEASNVIKQIASEDAPLSIIEKNQLSEKKLVDITSVPYSDLKRRLRVGGDFCIYIEDEKGNIVPIGKSYGIGSPNIVIGDKKCSQSTN